MIPVEPTTTARRSELLLRLAQAGARIQRELSRDAILQRACEALSGLGLRCSMAIRTEAGVRVEAVKLGDQLDRIEAAIGAPIVGPVRPMTPFLQRVWDDGCAYTSRWPEEASAFIGCPIADILQELGDGAFTRGIGVRVGDATGDALMLFATGAWLREEDLGAFRLFAEQVGGALDAARTVTQLRDRNAELAALNSIAALASGAEELGPLLDAAAALIRDAAGASAVGMVIGPAAAGEARRAHATPGPFDLATMLREVPTDAPVLAAVLRQGAVRIAHPEDVPPAVGGVWSAAGIGTVALVPLRFRGDPLGAIAVTFPDRRDAEECHVDLLGAIGGQLGAAIESHDLLASLRRRVAELTLLNDMGAATVALDSASLLDRVLRSMAKSFGADTFAAFIDRDGRREVVAHLGVEDMHGAPTLTPGDITQIATREKRAVRFPSEGGDTPRGRWFVEHARIRSSIAVPLLATERTIGSFVLGRRSATPFSDEDVRLLSLVGVHLGVVVENARLYEDLRRSYAALARAQEQLIQQERFAALGQLSAVVAHEVRKPLGVIFNVLGSLRRILEPRGDARMLLDIIGEESDRLNRIVGDLLDFARPAPPALRREQLAPLVDDAAQGAGLPPAIRFERDVAPDLPAVPMDPRLMRQALVNLLMNAAQAMPGGGTLAVRARVEGAAVRLEISDTGSGITEELRQRIFEPFFTTRPTGTGLGLAVVKRILDEHRASIRVEAGEPVGTRFVVLLPLTSGEATAPGPLSPVGQEE